MRKSKLLKLVLAALLAAGLTACDTGVGGSTKTDPEPTPEPTPATLKVAINRGANTVSVTGDTGAVSLTAISITISDTDGLDISLGGLGLSDYALTEITAASTNGSTKFVAMAPLASATQKQDSLAAKLDYGFYALLAMLEADLITTPEAQDLLSDFETAKYYKDENVDDEATAEFFETNYVFNADYDTIQEALEGVNSVHVLPNMAAIRAYYEANPTADNDYDDIADADSFNDAMLKVWWNKLDATNDATMNTAIEALIKASYAGVDSVAMMGNLKSNRGNELVSNPMELALAEVRVVRARA